MVTIISSYGLGISASLIGQLLMTIGFYIWDNHWKGSAYALNLFKCNFATIGFLIVTLITNYTTKDDEEVNNNTNNNNYNEDYDNTISKYTVHVIGYLLLSSVLGILIGDILWIYALQLLGAKRVIIMDSLKPFVAAFLGWWLLNETLDPAVIVGVILTLLGVIIVSFEQQQQQETPSSSSSTTTTSEYDNNVTTEANNINSNDDNNNKNNNNQQALINKSNNNRSHQSTNDKNEEKKEDHDVESYNIHDAINHENNIVMNDGTINHPHVIETFDPNQQPAQVNELQVSEDANNNNDIIRNDDNKNINNTNKNIGSNEPGSTVQKDNDDKNNKNNNLLLRGIMMSILNIIFDTYGAVLIKQNGILLSVWEINLIRFGFAGIVMIILSSILLLRDYYYKYYSNKKSYSSTTIIIDTNTLYNNENSSSNNNNRNNNSETSSKNNDNNDPNLLINVSAVENKLAQTTVAASTSELAVATDEIDNNTVRTNLLAPWYLLPTQNTQMTKSSWYRVCVGTIFVTFLTPTLSNYALFNIALALAITLGSTGPLYSLPLSYYCTSSSKEEEERKIPSISSIIGTLLAVAGIVILAYFGTTTAAD